MKTLVIYTDPETGERLTKECSDFDYIDSEHKFYFTPKLQYMIKSLSVDHPIVNISLHREKVYFQVTGYQYIDGQYQKTNTLIEWENKD